MPPGSFPRCRAVATGYLPNSLGKTQGMNTAQENHLADSSFAFPKERKEPLNDAAHVRDAIARFDQVEGVSDSERDQAWKRILAAAKKFGVEVSETNWRELFQDSKAKKY
jgi:hypothetical protein